MTEDTFRQEFLLAAACCRWPLSEGALAAIRNAHTLAIDWTDFMQIAHRQRVVALVHNALTAAGLDLPSGVAEKLASRAQKIAKQNLMLATETIRLQRAFDAAQIPVMVLKGVTLAKLAYGSLQLKHARDIDLLVPADRAETAMHLLERNDYSLVLPAANLNEAQRRAAIRYGKDVELVHRGNKSRVELQWRTAVNPFLLKGIDANSPTQNVSLSDDVNIRTLSEHDLFAYLCVHGANHAWFRLKWLADVNALIAQKADADIVRLYRHAQAKGAGLCAGQALLLCHRLLALRLSAEFEDELQGSKRLQRLVAAALRAMSNPNENPDRGLAGVTRIVFSRFLLGHGWAYFAAECRIASVGIEDVIRIQLPASLHFLYPILRLPLWLRRRARSGN